MKKIILAAFLINFVTILNSVWADDKIDKAIFNLNGNIEIKANNVYILNENKELINKIAEKIEGITAKLNKMEINNNVVVKPQISNNQQPPIVSENKTTGGSSLTENNHKTIILNNDHGISIIQQQLKELKDRLELLQKQEKKTNGNIFNGLRNELISVPDNDINNYKWLYSPTLKTWKLVKDGYYYVMLSDSDINNYEWAFDELSNHWKLVKNGVTNYRYRYSLKHDGNEIITQRPQSSPQYYYIPYGNGGSYGYNSGSCGSGNGSCGGYSGYNGYSGSYYGGFGGFSGGGGFTGGCSGGSANIIYCK